MATPHEYYDALLRLSWFDLLQDVVFPAVICGTA